MTEIETKSKLRVCHMIGSLRFGGAERQFVNTLNYLPCVAKFAISLQSQESARLHAFLHREIPLFWIGARRRYLPYYVWKIACLLRQLRIDVMHTHMLWVSLYGAVAARMAGVPVVVTTEHGKNLWKNAYHRWIERALVSRIADMRICVSEDVLCIRRDREGIPSEKLIYVPNGTEIPAPIIRKNSKPVMIGSVGRFIEAKDYPTLIKAAAILRDSGREFRLYILGDGPTRPHLERDIAALELQSMVHLPGFQCDIGNWLTQFDVFVMSSIREGLPLALLEGMAYGLPIVATRVGGIPNSVEHGREGILVEPRNPDALAAALQMLIDDFSKRCEFGERARQRAMREFSIQTVCKQHIELYETIWSRNTHASL
jgi:glycosyltransferase involved in cell wall biosynthesis